MNSVTQRLLLAMLSISGANAVADDAVNQLPKALLSYERPSFPAALQAASVSDGYATVAFVVRADGQIDDAVVLEASHPAFGESMLEVLPAWRFEGAADAAALPRREVFRFEFRQEGVVSSVSHRDAMKAAFPLTQQERMPIRTVLWTQLVTPPKRLSIFASTVKASASGRVSVSYVIDTNGRVRVPVIVDATRPDLGAAALAIVKQWQFSPPTHEGMPVLVEDQRWFTFGNN